MTYTATSTYGYITGDELEEYHILTYLSVDARYTEAVVMAKVSQAERVVRSLTNVTSSTDGTISLVLEYSKYLMEMQIYLDNPNTEAPPPDLTEFNRLFSLLNEVESYSPAGSVPMSGIDKR